MKNKDVTWQTGIRNAIPDEWNRLVHISLMEKEIIIFTYADNVLHKELLSFSHEPSDSKNHSKGCSLSLLFFASHCEAFPVDFYSPSSFYGAIQPHPDTQLRERKSSSCIKGKWKMERI